MSSNEERGDNNSFSKYTKQAKPDDKTLVLALDPDYLESCINMGFKLLPTYRNAIEFNTANLFTEEEYAEFPEAKHGVCRLLYLNPKLWTHEHIRKESWRFEGARALPGKTYVIKNDTVFGPYRLFILDVDSENAYNKIKSMLENDFLLNTYVTKSKKEFGYHIYWLEDWNDDDDCVFIESDDCKVGSEFELFTSAEYTQLAGQHKDDPTFRYQNVGCKQLKETAIMVRNGLYNQLTELLRDLLTDPTEFDTRRKAQRKNKDIFHRGGSNDKQSNYNPDINTVEINDLGKITTIEWALPFYGLEYEAENSQVKTSHYFHFSKALIGTLVREYAAQKSINNITDALHDKKPNSKYTKEFWHKLTEDSISRFHSGGEFAGIPSLIKQVRKHPKYQDLDSATKHVEDFLAILRVSIDTTAKKRTFTKNGLTKHQELKYKEHERDKRLAQEQLSERDIDFAFQCAIKEAPHDKVSILQLLHGCLSAFTKTPISHILSSLLPGAGKNHLILLVTSYIPEQYIIPYNRLSDKALFHMSGEMVISKFNYANGKEEVEPIESYLNELYQKLKQLQRKSKKSKTYNDLNEIDAIHDEIKDVLSTTQNLITLDNMIQVFLDTPPEGLWDTLMSLISQDSVRDQFYTFTDRKEANKSLSVTTTRLRGAPTIISAGVIDDTNNPRFGEKNRRLVHVNPNTSKEKIETAIRTINDQRLGTPIEYAEDYIRPEDKERSKHIFDVIIAKLKLHSEQFGYKDAGVYIPKIVRMAIADAIEVKDESVWSMTIDDRLVRYFSIIGLERMDNRLRLIDQNTGENRIILTFADLKRTLEFMNRSSSQVRPYISKFYNTAILPTYNACEHPNTGIRDGKEVQELERGVSSKQIHEYLKEHKKENFSPKIITERFLKPLVNQGILNETKSQIDRRASIYAPVKGFEAGISTLFDDDADPRLTVRHSEYYPSINRIDYDFFRLSTKTTLKRGDRKMSLYKIKNFDGDEIDFAVMKNYLGDPEKCFKMGFLEEEEKRHSQSKNTCLGRLFWHLKDQKWIAISKKPVEEAKKSVIVDDITNDENNLRKKLGMKNQNTFAERVPKFPLELDSKSASTVSNFHPYFPIEQSSTFNVPLARPKIDLESLTQTVAKSLNEIKANAQSLTPPNIPGFENYTAFDLEWYRDDLQSNISAGIAGLVYCATFIDRWGNATTLHLRDYENDHIAFLVDILDTMRRYNLLLGYCINEKKAPYKKDGGIDGDIEQLRRNIDNCENNEIKQAFEGVISRIEKLDLFPVFTFQHTKSILSTASKIKLRGNSLNAIST